MVMFIQNIRISYSINSILLIEVDKQMIQTVELINLDWQLYLIMMPLSQIEEITLKLELKHHIQQTLCN